MSNVLLFVLFYLLFTVVIMVIEMLFQIIANNCHELRSVDMFNKSDFKRKDFLIYPHLAPFVYLWHKYNHLIPRIKIKFEGDFSGLNKNMFDGE